MWRRSVLEFSSRHSVRRTPRQILPEGPFWQISPCVYARKEFSSAPKQNLKPQPSSKPPNSANSFPKIVFGSVAIGAAVFAAYETGYLDQLIGSKEQNSSVESTETASLKSNSVHVLPSVVMNVDPLDGQKSVKRDETRENPIREETEDANPIDKPTEQKVETDVYLSHHEASSEEPGDSRFHFQDNSSMIPDETTKVKDLPEFRPSNIELDDKNLESSSKTSPDVSFDTQSADSSINAGFHEAVQITPMPTQTQKDLAPEHFEMKTELHEDTRAKDKPEDVNSMGEGIDEPSSLLEAYHLKDEAQITSLGSRGTNEINKSLKATEALIAEIEESNDGYISKDGKLVIDFLQAIHAAEKRQAELDSRIFGEEKRALKEKLEKELRDARARDLMHAEEAAILEKELNRERVKAAAALKSLQEELEEKFQKEIEQKENEGDSKLKMFQDMSKAELAAAVASEKAAQIEKMAEANLHINALCMAFYARSEEARQNHSAQKLALGALALEDALSRGLPIQGEIEALRTGIQGIDKDSNLELVLSSIPDEILSHGSDTLLQMNQKFDELKTTLRHFSLIPPSGGGILAHSLARIASLIKVREVDQSGNGIESVISTVESYLAEGQLAEAAHSLEDGVKGTKASEVVGDWVRQARNRAVAEQALTLLQIYASSISLT